MPTPLPHVHCKLHIPVHAGATFVHGTLLMLMHTSASRVHCNGGRLCACNCYTHAQCVYTCSGPECMLPVPVDGGAICVQAYKCHICAECCESLVCRSHICTLQCRMLGAGSGVNSAVLHVPRHGDVTRVQCVTCASECLSNPTSAFPCARGAPVLHLLM